MKKITVLLLAAALSLTALAGCGRGNVSTTTDGNVNGTNATEPYDSRPEATTPVTRPEETREPETGGMGTSGLTEPSGSVGSTGEDPQGRSYYGGFMNGPGGSGIAGSFGPAGW